MEVNLDFRDKSAARILSFSLPLLPTLSLSLSSPAILYIYLLPYARPPIVILLRTQFYGAIRAVTKVSRVISRLCDLEVHVRDAPPLTLFPYIGILWFICDILVLDKNIEQ